MKGHVPEENLTQYRRLMNVAAHYKRVGGMVSGMNEVADANAAWASELKYRLMAMELRVDIPEKEGVNA